LIRASLVEVPKEAFKVEARAAALEKVLLGR
jgi:hypothetical protein